MPDLSGKVYIVTGSNSGIGKDTAKGLLEHHGKVYMAGRNEEKYLAVIEELEKDTGNRAVFLKLDLGNLLDVKRAAEEFLSKEQQLDALINNAGVMFPTADEDLTKQGYDAAFGANVLGHYLFTKLLLPVLFATTAAHPDVKARVVMVSSATYLNVNGIDYDTLRDGKPRRSTSNVVRYSQSKLALILLANELNRRYSDKIVSISLHPGSISTELFRTLHWTFVMFAKTVALKSPRYGAITSLYAATALEAASMGGKYLIPWARVGNPTKTTTDPAEWSKLWDWLEDQVKDI